ncbi:MAG: threonylcarbamoyl-AMP synthase [Erysipelotrichaceae bacterium]|nr:threonylcarbamoyl-AMP synthase [Erysipelotrichaceae bacterium]
MSKVIIFPTDTVYGIGTPIFDLEGIDRIYSIKKRDKSKPLACLCCDLNQIKSIAYVNEKSIELINRYLPGALTIILKSKEEIKEKIGYDTIGVRIPDNKIALEILRENGPMLTTSVNDSGSNPINEYDEIVIKYSNLADEIYMSDNKSSNISSTVVMCIDDTIKVLREGEIKIDV